MNSMYGGGRLCLFRKFMLLLIVLCMAGIFTPLHKTARAGGSLMILPSKTGVLPMVFMSDSYNRGQYQGNLRVYVVEPDSRWANQDGGSWYNGFLAFACDTMLSLNYQEQFNKSLSWTPVASLSPIDESNIMVIAVMFNKMEGHTSNSNYPPDDDGEFIAYYADAAASAIPGETGYNDAAGEYTHTVFLEELCAGACSNCPYTRDAIHSLDEGGQYNFLYATITSQNPTAQDNDRMNELNKIWVPTTYFDGGQEVMVGGYENEDFYADFMDSCGAREVPELDLSVSLEYNSKGSLDIDVSITLNTSFNSAPDKPALPEGPETGYLGHLHSYSSSAEDIDGDQLFYRWSWGDGDTSEWMGPYDSGDTCQASHSWSMPDTYEIKVQARDEFEVESEWSDVKSAQFETYFCGDANFNNSLNIADAVTIIYYLYVGGSSPLPLCVGDADRDGDTSIDDAYVIINYVFAGGAAPQAGCCDPPW